MIASPCRLAVAQELTTASAVGLSGLEGLEYDPASPQGGGARSRSGPTRPSPTQNDGSCSFSKEVGMPHFLSEDELQRTAPAETAAFASPVPPQLVSNGEDNPLP